MYFLALHIKTETKLTGRNKNNLLLGFVIAGKIPDHEYQHDKIIADLENIDKVIYEGNPNGLFCQPNSTAGFNDYDTSVVRGLEINSRKKEDIRNMCDEDKSFCDNYNPRHW